MCKCKQRRKSLNGYMTLEASFIMPWVIFLFAFLIYASFYLYDKCVLYQDVYVLALRGSVQKEEAEVLEYVNGHMSAQFGSKYFGVGRVEGRAENPIRKLRLPGAAA